MAQYSEAFILNLSLDGRVLIRKRLQQIRLQDLSKMNITNFLHQKILMDHISHVLQNPFHSPVRRSEIKAKLAMKYPDVDLEESNAGPSAIAGDKAAVGKKRNGEDKKRSDSAQRKGGKKITRTRRRSFDHDVWQSISNLRTRDANSTVAAGLLREGVLSQEPKKIKNAKNQALRRARHR